MVALEKEKRGHIPKTLRRNPKRDLIDQLVWRTREREESKMIGDSCLGEWGHTLKEDFRRRQWFGKDAKQFDSTESERPLCNMGNLGVALSEEGIGEPQRRAWDSFTEK